MREYLSWLLVLTLCFLTSDFHVFGHIVPAEKFHPVSESYRRMNFLLSLNPVPWDSVLGDVEVIMDGMAGLDPVEASDYRANVRSVMGALDQAPDRPAGPDERKAAAREIFRICTMTVAEALLVRLSEAEQQLDQYREATRSLEQARQLWQSFEHEVKSTDPAAHRMIGRAWLAMNSALGSPGVLGVGMVKSDVDLFRGEAARVRDYVQSNYGDDFRISYSGGLVPLPANSPTFDASRAVPVKLPPGSNINKQLPRPRQILNMAERGVDEGETTLIALGDMAFDSSMIFGEPARSLMISCNTCHNKSITNPNFTIPGLSAYPGGMDVSNSFFAPHANNGHFDALDIPDLRGIRFTAPYGRNGRFGSLREFVRNVIVNEFNGPEPDPVIMDGIIAYMVEFDFLPNPALDPDGSLNDRASAAARRGEKIFHRSFENMNGRSCADCHIPSSNFLDHKIHNIGSVEGPGPYSRDGAMDTPTLLGIKYTAPYFHDGSLDTLEQVTVWFDREYKLGLSARERDDLTAYVETVGDGIEAYEDTVHTLDAELEEFRFFLSTYEYLKQRGKRDLIGVTFRTIKNEIQAHKWDVQDGQHIPVLNQMAELMEEAWKANEQGEHLLVDDKVEAYRRLYAEHADKLI